MKPLKQTLEPVKEWLRDSFLELKGKGLTYWLVVCLLVLIGMLMGDLISERKVFVGSRYWLYNQLQRTDLRSSAKSNHVRTVIIGDEEFWKGELVRRTPLKRKYLASLIERLDAVHPKAIALDVDLDSQNFDNGVVDDYREENDVLRKAISNSEAHIVLPRSLIFEGASGDEPVLLPSKPRQYVLQPSIFNLAEFAQGHVSEGYISLPYDIRQVPLVLRLKDGLEIDSFAAAIARVVDDECVENARRGEKDSLPYGTFLSSRGFTPLSANAVFKMANGDLEKQIGGKVVLIGGTWHQMAYGQGRQVDLHETPVGTIGGVVVHANYVEALLTTHGITKPLGEAWGLTLEVVLSLLIAVIFAWEMTPLMKLLWAGLVSVALIVVSYVAWQNLGLFFDFSIPLILLGGHTAFEKVREWRREARRYAKLQKAREANQCATT